MLDDMVICRTPRICATAGPAALAPNRREMLLRNGTGPVIDG